MAAIASLLVGATGCTASCKAYAAPSLRVQVLDTSHKPICDAVVVARDGDFSETLSAFPRDASGRCFYSGPYERMGTYTIEARAHGLVATAANVKVSADQCHVITKEVVLTIGT